MTIYDRINLSKFFKYSWFAFLFQTNPSPSDETNHTDSLSTSYDTSADPQSLNATTPGQGALHDDHSGLHVRNNTYILTYVLVLVFVQMRLLSSENLISLFFQGRVCGDDEDTQAQDDELSLSANELLQGSDCGESFTLELPGQPQDQLRSLEHSLNPDYYQPPLDFLDPNCLPR